MTLRNVLSDGVLAVGTAVGLLTLGACAAPAVPQKASLAGAETVEASPRGGSSEPQVEPTPRTDPTPAGGQPWDTAASDACRGTLGARYTEAAQSPDGEGVTSFWVSGNRWVVCDVADHAAPVTIESGKQRAGFDETALALATTSLSSGDETAVRLVAGGRLPWPVEEIGYSFPDGHTERARFVTSEDDPGTTWWVVSYTAKQGPLADPDLDPAAADLEPVTISIIGATAEAFRLPWEDVRRSE
jgi:hypothetical protein